MSSALAGLVIAASAILVRLPTLAEPLAMDQALFAVIGRGLLRGDRLYVDLWDHKPPAIYLVYAALQRVFGGSAWVIALASTAAAAATALLVRCVIARLAGERAGFLAGLFYALIANPILLGGFYATGQAEAFMDLCVVSALAAAAPARGPAHRPRRARRARRAGVWLGIAALFKPTALLWIPVAWLVARRDSDGGAPARLRSLAMLMLAGVAVPLLVALLGLAATGALGAAADAIVGWNAAALRGTASAAGASRDAGIGAILGSPRAVASLLFDGIIRLGPFLLFAAIGAVAALGARGRAIPLVWLATAIVAAIVQGKFYRYQYQPLFAPVAALAALGAERALVEAERRAAPRAAAAAIAALVALSLVPLGAAVARYWRDHRYALPFPTGAARDAFLSTYTWSDPPMRYDDAARVARRIRAASAPEERIFVLGFDPQIYLLSERAPAGRYLAHDHIRAPGAEARLVDDFDRRPPRWVVVATDEVGPLDFARVSDWIAARMEARETIGRFALFERVR